MKKLKNLCRLLSTLLAISLIIVGTTLTVFANENVDVPIEETTEEIADIQLESTADTTENVIVHISKDGNISYETITSEETSTYSDEDIVILNDAPSALQDDDVMATASSNDLQDVSPFSVSFAPYKHMCLLTATFPDGTVEESSGILISKNLVLASAHGIYKSKYGGAAKSVIIGVGAYFSGSERKYQGYVQNWNGAVLSKKWAESELLKEDWSLIKLSQTVDSYQRCGYVDDFTKATGKDIRLIGYPGIENVGAVSFKTSIGQITGTTNVISTKEQYKNLWKLSAECTQGMSGGPVVEESTGTVIGVIHGRVVNAFGVQTPVGVPLTKEIADVILQNVEW